MSEINRPMTGDILDHATAELRASAASSGVPSELTAATIEILKSRFVTTVFPQQTGRMVENKSTRRSRMIRIAQWSSLGIATAVLLAIALLWLPGSHSFAQIVENVKKATSVSLTQKQLAGSQEEATVRCFLQGEQMRLEILPNNIIVVDFKKIEAAQIDLEAKTHQPIANLNREAMKQLGSPLKWLADLSNENVELVGSEDLNGRKTHVYQLKKINYPLGFGQLDEKKTNRIWVDSTTSLPVKIVVNYFDILNKRDTRDEYVDFKWNKPIAAELFSLECPQGFNVGDSIGEDPAPLPFLQMLQNIRKAKSVVFTNHISSEPIPGRRLESLTKNYVQGNLCRSEDFKAKDEVKPVLAGVFVYNATQKKGLHLNYESKVAKVFPLDDLAASFLTNSLDALSEDATEYLGEEQWNGRKVLVFKVKNFEVQPGRRIKENETAKIWIDPENQWPVQILLETWLPGSEKNKPFINKQLMTDFQWNQPLDPILFSTEVPKGFTLIEEQRGNQRR